MGKRIFASILAVMMIGVAGASLTGCSNNGTPVASTASEMEFTEIQWPDSDIAKLIPEPESKTGHIEWEASYGFVIDIANTDQEAFNNYIEACKERGFTIDYQRGDDFYYADNTDGYRLTLQLRENNVMLVRMDEPDEESEAQTSSATTSSASSTDSVDPDFKVIMDNYESFMNNYCDFMERYNSSSNPGELISDYTDYMTQYSQLMTQISQIDTSSLSAADLAYYTEVTNRVNQRLAELS